MNKKIVHDALILTAFTLVLGLILGIVYGITKDPIDKANADTARAAYQEVFKDAVSFEAYEYDKDKPPMIRINQPRASSQRSTFPDSIKI